MNRIDRLGHLMRIGDLPTGDDAPENLAMSLRVPPEQHFRELRCDFNAAIKRALRASDADPASKRAIKQAAGLVARRRPYLPLMSHRGMRKHAGPYLARELRPHFPPSSGQRWFFCTFITDLGNSLEYFPVIELGRLKRDVWKMLQLADLHAIGVVELQRARYPGGRGAGRTIMAHVHVVGYTYDTTLTAKSAEKVIAGSSTLSSWLGARVADFRSIDSVAELEFRCNYLFKAPLQESYLRKDAWKPSGFETLNNASVDSWGALRLVEILSQLTLREATIARGELVKPKSAWHRRITAYMRRHVAPRELDYGAAFQTVWGEHPVRRTRAVPQIRRTAALALDDAWKDAMANLFAEVAQNQARYSLRQSQKRLR